MTSDQVIDKAGKYLAYKQRTRKELVDHLQKKGCSREEAEACADRMEEYHLIDDAEYARLYIESRLASGRGMNRIRAELAGKGIDGNTIEDALLLLENLPDEDEIALEQALAALDGVQVRGLEYEQKQKLMARIARRLAGRGFRTDTVYRAARTAFSKKEQEEEEHGL